MASLRLDWVPADSSALRTVPVLDRPLDASGLAFVLAVRLSPAFRIDVRVAPDNVSLCVLLLLEVRVGANSRDFGRSEIVFDLATSRRGADMILVDCVRV
jgi:hypothetical protein